MKNVVAYVRVSTDAQAGEDRYGIEAQKSDIMAYCSKNDMQVSEWYIDQGASGASDERPELGRLLYSDAAISNPPIEALIIAKSDRLARDIKIYYYYKMLLDRANVKLISVSEDFGEMGMFAPMLEAFTLVAAQMERENINRRTSGGRAVKASKGGYSGGRPPLGYDAVDRKLVVNQHEAEIVRTLFSLRKQGLTTSEIALALNEKGYRGKSGKPFSSGTVTILLHNEDFYRGWYTYGDSERVRGGHEAILVDE